MTVEDSWVGVSDKTMATDVTSGNNNFDHSRDGHLLIGGTGRAGTSFLVRYLTELGLDTHLSRHGEEGSWDEAAQAGLETFPFPRIESDLPYVLKYPWLYQCIDHILQNDIIRMDAVIVPIRDLNEAATSRILVELQAMHSRAPWMAEADQSWEVWGSTTGGVTYSLNPIDQGRLLAVGFHHLVERLVRADVPIIPLAFPRLAEDPRYLFEKLQRVLPATVSETAAVAAHGRVVDRSKIRVGAELETATEPQSHVASPSTRYPSRDKLETVAGNREITRLRKALAVAETEAATKARLAATLAEEQAAATEQAREELKKARLAATRARERTAAAIRTEEQTAAANAALLAEVARLRGDLDVVFASRSWRLSRPYRAIGGFLQRILGKGDGVPGDSVEPCEPLALKAITAPSYAHVHAHSHDEDARTIEWLDNDTFKTRHFTFSISVDRFDGRTAGEVVALLKDRKFIEIYEDLLNELRPERILEIGFFQGGMPLLMAGLVEPEKIVGVDYLQPSDDLLAMITTAGLEDTIRLYGNTLQADLPSMQRIVKTEFGDQPIDLIIDDASHEYENSRGCFQELFGYLRPGGKYVIEDWGWLHWPGDEWQTQKSHFWAQPAMTNLIFEIVMALGTQHPKVIGRIEILSWACVVVTRGEGLAHGERVDLEKSRLTSGRKFHPL